MLTTLTKARKMKTASTNKLKRSPWLAVTDQRVAQVHLSGLVKAATGSARVSERGRRRALRDADAGRPAGLDVGRVVAAGDSGCVPEQPAGALDAAHGGEPPRQRRQLRELERGPAGGTRRWWPYAAAAGTTAADGRGRNSPYTAALLAHLEQLLEVGLLFRRVRAQVLASTNGAQRTHEVPLAGG